ncbi:MAG: EAL domain-containing protein [Rhodocyclaceae bacterium]|nr:EAL domain-containing protein [Rhodocyclaceae bacterium]
MKDEKPPPAGGQNEEIAALIGKLHRTERRLEELTAGEVDTVADRDGRTFLLHRAQEYMRHSEASKQAAILDALPAHIALIDTQGLVLSVNEAWRQFARENELKAQREGIGLDYLAICDSAQGADATEAHQAAKGIRSVLRGEIKNFSIEYPCHSPTAQRWFLMTATPLTADRPNGAVVMHYNITQRKLGEQSVLRFAGAIDAIADAIFLVDRSSMRIIHVNDAACYMLSQTRATLLSQEPWELLSTSRAKLEALYDGIIARGVKAEPLEMQHRRADGAETWIDVRRHAQRFDNNWVIVTLIRDITEQKHAALALKESKRRFSHTLDNMDLASVMLDREARITYCNDYLLRLSGWRREELIGKNWFEIFLPSEVEVMKLAFQALLDNAPDAWNRENRIRTRSGEYRVIHWSNSILRAESGEVVGTSSIGEDITERRQAEEKIIYLNRVYAVLSGINTLIVRVSTRDELFREACRIAVEAGGFRMALIGIRDPHTMAMVPVASAGVSEDLMIAINNHLSSSKDAPNTMIARATREKKVVVSNDSQSDPQVLLGRIHAEYGIHSMAILPLIVADEAVGVLALYAIEIGFFQEEELKLLTELANDIAFAIDHINKQERLAYLAYYDVLTGLANRTLFLERVALYIRSATGSGHKLAVFLIDLERFKNINDSLGRAAGDALLRQVVEWLMHSVGDVNLLARLDADHFAVVLPKVAQEGNLVRLVEKQMSAFFEHPFILQDAVFRISAKIGVALFPDDGSNADTLFRNAEAALKKAKACGERYLFHTQTMTEAVAGKLSLENQLYQALDKGEFVLHYQPKVSLASGKLTSAEALLRWNDPRTDLVPPGNFIPILEETGLIHDVGRWVLRKAIEDYLRWRKAGLAAVRIAVNVSAMQLRDPGFIAEIEQVIAIDPLAAAGLELEITESLVMEDVKHSIASLRAIRALGVSIAIDDFGTGFSSLSYLSKLPVDTLKIDRSFVIEMTAGAEGLALVSTIIGLAHALKLKVVAEGVETEEQSRLLRLLDCDEIQGYLFSKPIPGELFETKYLAPLAPD